MDNELLEKAQAIISDRRHKALSENEMRINEINQRIPQIKEINDTLFNTGRDLIRLISEAKGSDVSAKVEEIKRNNLGAQAMARQLLTANGYPEDYLDIHYTCKKCNDTGYCRYSFCDCLRKVIGKLSADELNREAQLELSSFDTFKLSYYHGDDYYTMERIYNYTRRYAEQFTPNSESILMFGKTGLGKTHLSLAIANAVLQKGYSVIYDSVINLLRIVENEHFSRDHSSEMIDMLMNTELLIMDDLGTEYVSTFYSSTVYNIINTRLNRRKPTIISTNLDFKGISGRYDERVVSRLTSTYTCLEFVGDDVRLQMKLNNSANK
ncbi:ATP-binding protein [Ruminococcus sp. XPD3002]|uniref:ATP-binding protein n=1 Tax=Ruminococcus sp. XPD3002 TaxID=1452269 RepID=UPI00091AD1AE|nr:DNA replication protein DnaC [Ruminococcus flavefaciens]